MRTMGAAIQERRTAQPYDVLRLPCGIDIPVAPETNKVAAVIQESLIAS